MTQKWFVYLDEGTQVTGLTLWLVDDPLLRSLLYQHSNYAHLQTTKISLVHSWHFLTEGGVREGHWMLTRDSSLSSQPFVCNSALIAIAAEVPRLENVN